MKIQLVSLYKDHKKIFLIASILFISYMLLYTLPPRQKNPVHVIKGYLSWDTEQTVLPLSGEWLYQEGLKGNSTTWPRAYAQVPQAWNPTRFGTATYRLVVDNLKQNGDYALLLPYQATAYRLYIDGRIVAENGRVGGDKETSVPGYHPMILPVEAMENSIDMILQVSNYHHRRGGPFQAIYFGDRTVIESLDLWNVIRDWAFVIIFATMGLSQFTFYIIRKDKAGFYLGLFFLFTAINGMIGTPEVLIFHLWPLFPWHLYQKICYYISYTIVLWILLFVHRLYGEIGRRVLRILYIPLLGINLFVTLTPVWIYSVLNELFQLYSIFIISIVGAQLVLAFRQKLSSSRIMLIAYGLIIASMYGGIYFSNNRITTGPFLPLSFLHYYNPALFNPRSIYLTSLSYILLLVLLNILSLSYFLRNPLGIKNSIMGKNEVSQLIELSRDQVVTIAKGYSLSERETEVAQLLLLGKKNTEICDTLFISMSTVKTHIGRIFNKTGVNSRSELFFRFQRDLQNKAEKPVEINGG